MEGGDVLHVKRGQIIREGEMSGEISPGGIVRMPSVF